MAWFWGVFRARPRVVVTLLILLIDVAIRGVLKQRLMGTPGGFQKEQLCGSNTSESISVKQKNTRYTDILY